MKTTATASILRPATVIGSSCHPVLLPLAARRNYAAQGGSSSALKRRSVTPFNDDGHVPWSQLSGAEKTARAAQQSFNFGFILVGVGLTGVVGYFLFTDVFSPESKTTYFNRAVDRIRKDHRCLELLGEGKKIRAHGEETHNRWARSRPIASTERTDPQGNHHLLMHFYVSANWFLVCCLTIFWNPSLIVS
jgi:mitochondrial import inner membrane translocase subunit TIM21